MMGLYSAVGVAIGVLLGGFGLLAVKAGWISDAESTQQQLSQVGGGSQRKLSTVAVIAGGLMLAFAVRNGRTAVIVPAAFLLGIGLLTAIVSFVRSRRAA